MEEFKVGYSFCLMSFINFTASVWCTHLHETLVVNMLLWIEFLYYTKKICLGRTVIFSMCG